MPRSPSPTLSRQSPPDTSPWLSAAQVAAHLCVSLRSVREWTRRGQMPCHYLPGRLVRYHRDEIDAWLKESRP